MESWLENFARANFLRSADTAHDLKTPLNVAVLNLELLRMRLRKLAGDDEKITLYATAIDTELRRMGRIFDAFFLLSTPPRNESAPAAVEITSICREAASAAGMVLSDDQATAHVFGHESRIRQACKLFFEGSAKLLAAEGRAARTETEGSRHSVLMTGSAAQPDLELSKVFKLYYSDAEGNPDLSLAIARLIAETYGGELIAVSERDKVVLRLSFPLGAE